MPNKTQYEDLIVRLDERSLNTYHELTELKNHIIEQNGLIRDTVFQTTKNTTWIKAFRWISGITISALAIIITRLLGLW